MCIKVGVFRYLVIFLFHPHQVHQLPAKTIKKSQNILFNQSLSIQKSKHASIINTLLRFQGTPNSFSSQLTTRDANLISSIFILQWNPNPPSQQSPSSAGQQAPASQVSKTVFQSDTPSTSSPAHPPNSPPSPPSTPI